MRDPQRHRHHRDGVQFAELIVKTTLRTLSDSITEILFTSRPIHTVSEHTLRPRPVPHHSDQKAQATLLSYIVLRWFSGLSLQSGSMSTSCPWPASLFSVSAERG